MPHELKLSKKQFNALVRDVHKDMMKGSGLTDGTYAAPPTIPEFSGPDLSFFVEDSGMEGGGWRDTLSSVWNSVHDRGCCATATYCKLQPVHCKTLQRSERGW